MTFRPENGFAGEITLQYTVTDDDEKPLDANEVITPNGDLKNDIFFVEFMNPDRENLLIIYEAVGNEVFITEDYRNDWGGIDRSGNDLTSDVYYYSFKEFNSDGTLHDELKGIIQIVK